MTYDILITNGQIVSAEETRTADVGIVGERIAEVGLRLPREGAGRVIDAAGKLVIPGGVDVHTHLDMPLGDIHSSDDFETGTRAAAFGGTTTIIDFANQKKGHSLHQAVEEWKARAAGKAVIDYGLHCTICDLAPGVLEEVDELVGEGVSSFKVFTAYPGRLMLEDGAILQVLQRCRRNGGLVCVHAENGPAIEALIHWALSSGHTEPKYHAITRPPVTEAEAARRVIALAEKAGAPLYIVHVTCRESLEQIAAARARSLPVFAETCPQYLYLTGDDLDRPGFEGAKYVLTPPLRTQRDREALWDGLRAGTLQAVSTDHCPFNYRGQKELGRDDFTKIPNGGPGIEHRLSLLYSGGVLTGRFSENRFVELVSTAPAKIFGLYPRKGAIVAGSDADVVIFNPQAERTISARTHHMRVDYSMYEGFKVRGAAEVVMTRGQVIVEQEACSARAGRGKFVKRERFSPALMAQYSPDRL